MPSDTVENLVSTQEELVTRLFDLHSIDQYGKFSPAYVRCHT